MSANGSNAEIVHPSARIEEGKREQLFRAALDEFAAEGFSGSSLNRIIASVGMSKSSFYNYFESKLDLLETTIDYFLQPYFGEFMGFDFASLNENNFWPTLADIIVGQSLTAAQAPHLQKVASIVKDARVQALESKRIEAHFEATRTWLENLVDQGQQLGQVRNDLPTKLLVELLSATSDVFDDWIATNTTKNEAEVLALANKAVEIQKVLMTQSHTPS